MSAYAHSLRAITARHGATQAAAKRAYWMIRTGVADIAC